MATVDIFPDAEAAVSIYLRAQAFTNQRVYSSIPADPTYPLVRVQRVGGVPKTDMYMRLDDADIQFDVYAESKSAARLLASQVRQSVFAMEGQTIVIASGNAFVAGVTDVLGLTWMPDASNPVTNRYVFSLRASLHAA